MKPSSSTLQIGLMAFPSQTSGSDRYFYELLRALQARGARATGIVLGDPKSVQDCPPGVVSFAPEGSRALPRWQGLRRAVRPLVAGHSVVVSHFAPHVFPVLDVIASRPLVEHFHGPWALEGRYAHVPGRTIALRLLQEHSVYRRAKRIIVLSQAFGDVLARDYRIDPEKIRIVPGGVDVARFTPRGSRRAAREELGLPLDRPIVIAVRRLESTKGVDRLILAIDAVRRHARDVLLVVAGTGSLAEPLATLVRERGLHDHVRFAGKIGDDELARLYRAADLSVVPSQAWEGFGLTCLESLASGTPVLVTPVGGLPEAVSGLDEALVLSGTEPEAIAAGIVAAFCGRNSLPAEAACAAYAQRFAWAAIAERADGIYREVA